VVPELLGHGLMMVSVGIKFKKIDLYYVFIGKLLCKAKNVKCKIVHALRLCTGHTAYRVSRGIAILYRH